MFLSLVYLVGSKARITHVSANKACSENYFFSTGDPFGPSQCYRWNAAPCACRTVLYPLSYTLAPKVNDSSSMGMHLFCDHSKEKVQHLFSLCIHLLIHSTNIYYVRHCSRHWEHNIKTTLDVVMEFTFYGKWTAFMALVDPNHVNTLSSFQSCVVLAESMHHVSKPKHEKQSQPWLEWDKGQGPAVSCVLHPPLLPFPQWTPRLCTGLCDTSAQCNMAVSVCYWRNPLNTHIHRRQHCVPISPCVCLSLFTARSTVLTQTRSLSRALY